MLPFTQFPKHIRTQKERGTLIQITQTRLSFFFFFSPTSFSTLNFLPIWAASLLLTLSPELSVSEHLLSVIFSLLPSLPQHTGNTINWEEARLKIPEKKHRFLHLKHKSLVQNYPWGHGSQKDKTYTLYIAKTRKDLNVWGFQVQGNNYFVHLLVKVLV